MSHRAILLLLSIPLSALAQPATAPFDVLDNIERENVDLLFAPYEPMALSADGLNLYAVNTHGSRVVRYNGLSGQPAMTYDVPWGPVSVGYWNNPDGPDELLVVTRGTYGLTRLDPDTGDLLGFLPLPSCPAPGRSGAPPRAGCSRRVHRRAARARRRRTGAPGPRRPTRAPARTCWLVAQPLLLRRTRSCRGSARHRR